MVSFFLRFWSHSWADKWLVFFWFIMSFCFVCYWHFGANKWLFFYVSTLGHSGAEKERQGERESKRERERIQKNRISAHTKFHAI